MARPQGMISVLEYADKHSERVNYIIDKIKDGVYIGVESDGEWYIEESDDPQPTVNYKANVMVTSANTSTGSVKTSYGTARFLLKLSIFIGWLFVVFGVFLLIKGLFANGQMLGESLMKGAVAAIIGLAAIQASQVAMAIPDTADNTKAILKAIQSEQEGG